MTKCISEPVSWLRLERYALGESGEADRGAIAEHLAACGACRACFERIEADAKADLPPLPAPKRARRDRVVRIGAAAGAALALAAAAILGVGRWNAPSAESSRVRVKGDGVAFSLVRDDDQLIAEAGGVFRASDRFKALVTCPPEMRARFDVVVFEGGGATFPLESPSDFACGNDVPLPGAFRITGSEPARVCLVWGDQPIDRAMLSHQRDESALPRAVCKVLQPAP
jgi:anti-sigma factor RsiW